jgi:hypothetical protein
MKIRYLFNPIKSIVWISLWVLLLASGCSGAGNNIPAEFQPVESGVNPDEWAKDYPLQYGDWEASAHGQSYLQGDPNAPGCADCHADPGLEETHTAEFRLNIPARCGRCHSDSSMMKEYGTSADVYTTYLADYHGTTIEYYRANSPTAWRYEAVCSDCHGSHAVYAVDDKRSSVSPQNLLLACQKCHQDATSNFASAFGHYRPIRQAVSTAESPILFWVKLFYQALIPVVLGGMFIYIGIDIAYRIKRKNHAKQNA